jgi:5-formyltetrahydrofolate cyclo-ligase
MSEEINRKKSELRKSILSKRSALDPKVVKLASGEVVNQLKEFGLLSASTTFAGYFAFNNEVDLQRLFGVYLELRKELYFPVYDTASKSYQLSKLTSLENIKIGKYGILEPKESLDLLSEQEAQEKIEVWFVPGVAFDHRGHRLGLGKGYYDGFLRNSKGIKVGVAYDFQVFQEAIPSLSHDVSMDIIATDRHVYRIVE